jgi:hypothetical protein
MKERLKVKVHSGGGRVLTEDSMWNLHQSFLFVGMAYHVPD